MQILFIAPRHVGSLFAGYSIMADRGDSSEDEPTIAEDIIVTKYKMAGDMANSKCCCVIRGAACVLVTCRSTEGSVCRGSRRRHSARSVQAWGPDDAGRDEERVQEGERYEER